MTYFCNRARLAALRLRLLCSHLLIVFFIRVRVRLLLLWLFPWFLTLFLGRSMSFSRFVVARSNVLLDCIFIHQGTNIQIGDLFFEPWQFFRQAFDSLIRKQLDWIRVITMFSLIFLFKLRPLALLNRCPLSMILHLVASINAILIGRARGILFTRCIKV